MRLMRPGVSINFPATLNDTELAWRSGSVMDCHATIRSSNPGGNGVKTELHVLRMRH